MSYDMRELIEAVEQLNENYYTAAKAAKYGDQETFMDALSVLKRTPEYDRALKIFNKVSRNDDLEKIQAFIKSRFVTEN